MPDNYGIRVYDLQGPLGPDYTDVLGRVLFQGTQTRVTVLDRAERVGFYNTFVARSPDGTDLPDGVTVEADPVTGDVHALAGPHFRGVQFHAESILTENGFDLIRELLLSLLHS